MLNKKSKLLVSVVSVVVSVVLAAGGYLCYQVKKQVDGEIYGTPRGEIEQTSPEDLGLPYEDISYRTDSDLRIDGWFIPRDGSSDCVILAPGKGSTKWNILKYAPFLHKGGFNLLVFDPRGRGESEGNRWAFGYLEARDIAHGIDFIRSSYGIDDVGLLGRSAGATASLISGVEEPRVDAVVADSPFASIKMASMSYGNYQKNPLFQAVFPLYTLTAQLTLGFDVNHKTNLNRRIKDANFPAFFIHGREDEVILPENSEVLYKEKTKPKEIWKPLEVKHVGAFEVYPDEYKTRVLNFFSSHL